MDLDVEDHQFANILKGRSFSSRIARVFSRTKEGKLNKIQLRLNPRGYLGIRHQRNSTEQKIEREVKRK